VSEERARRNPDAPQSPARPERDDAPASDYTEERRVTRKEQDVLLDVSELEVDKITLEVAGLGPTSRSWRSLQAS
jgi:hypothetical protein